MHRWTVMIPDLSRRPEKAAMAYRKSHVKNPASSRHQKLARMATRTSENQMGEW